ncbi:MAG TPA: hypothetical protein VEZ88_04555 [Steroidobacteraceae bacterium]|nr:hypothetical protein [Steroidobacteraceae bacterium]
MERLERFYKIDQLLEDRKVVSFATFKEVLGMSREREARPRIHAQPLQCADRVRPRAERLPLRQAALRQAAQRY